MTPSSVWHDSFIHVTHAYVWHDPFVCVTWLILTCGVTHSSVQHDYFTCATWLTHMWDKTHSYVSHESSTWGAVQCEETEKRPKKKRIKRQRHPRTEGIWIRFLQVPTFGVYLLDLTTPNHGVLIPLMQKIGDVDRNSSETWCFVPHLFREVRQSPKGCSVLQRVVRQGNMGLFCERAL